MNAESCEKNYFVSAICHQKNIFYHRQKKKKNEKKKIDHKKKYKKVKSFNDFPKTIEKKRVYSSDVCFFFFLIP